MMRGKPTCGYPSRIDAILAFRSLGLDTPSIAARCGVSRQTVASLERQHRIGNVRGEDTLRRTLTLPRHVVDALAPHAAARNTGARELAVRILDAIAGDGLVDAILDDAP